VKLLECEPSGSLLHFPVNLLLLLVSAFRAFGSYLADIVKDLRELILRELKTHHQALIDEVLSEHELVTRKGLLARCLLLRVKLLVGFLN
jgi:hypothetical protein